MQASPEADAPLLKPPRTLGVSLAILLSVFLFTVIPLTQIGVLTIIQHRAASVEIPDQSGPAIAVGGNFGAESNTFLVIQAMLGIVFFILAIFAWRGKPHSIRLLMMIAVLVLTVFNVWDSISALLTPPSVASGLDSGGGLRAALQCAHLVGEIMVPLYSLWYMNRGPARAFYRGYYLPRPNETPVNEPVSSP